MVHIAICDDEKNICAELNRTLVDILKKHDVRYNIDIFHSGNELLREMETGGDYDLVFLDIVFASKEINGVEVGRLIRDANKNLKVQVVFISWEEKYAMQLFELRPLNFLVKPLEYGRIEQVVKTFFTVADILDEELTFKKGRDIHTVKIKDIVYLENRQRMVVIYLANGTSEEFYGSLKEIYDEQLKQLDFLFIHASFVVNFEYIATMKYNELFLADTNKLLPISRNNRDEVRDTHMEITKRRRV